jgi:hypothetical protein
METQCLHLFDKMDVGFSAPLVLRSPVLMEEKLTLRQV